MDFKQKTEILTKYIGCSDCKIQWKGYCPLCKKQGKRLKDANGNPYPIKKAPPKVRAILKKPFWYSVEVPARKTHLMEKTGLTLNLPFWFDDEKSKNNAVVKKVFKKEQPVPITIDNFFIASTGTFQEIKEIPEGFTLFFKSKGSKYYTGQTKDKLVRVSDHWGFSIRHCNWYLEGYKKAHCSSWYKKHSNPVKMGIIDYSKLKPVK